MSKATWNLKYWLAAFCLAMSTYSVTWAAQRDSGTIGGKTVMEYKREIGNDFIRKLMITEHLSFPKDGWRTNVGSNCALTLHLWSSEEQATQALKTRHEFAVQSVTVPMENGPFLAINFEDRVFDRIFCEFDNNTNAGSLTLQEVSKKMGPVEFTQLKDFAY
jgi:hypothetical protein